MDGGFAPPLGIVLDYPRYAYVNKHILAGIGKGREGLYKKLGGEHSGLLHQTCLPKGKREDDCLDLFFDSEKSSDRYKPRSAYINKHVLAGIGKGRGPL